MYILFYDGCKITMRGIDASSKNGVERITNIYQMLKYM